MLGNKYRVNFKTCTNLQNTNVLCLSFSGFYAHFVGVGVGTKVPFSSSICVLFQYRHRISKQFKIFLQSLNAATNTIFILLQTNFNKAFCDYFVFSNFQIVYPFRFQQVEIFTQFAVLFFRFFRCRVYALFEIITWHFARCHQSFDTWFALFETFAHNDCQIILMFHINSRLSELHFEL